MIRFRTISSLLALVVVISACKTKPIPVYSLTYEIDVFNQQPFDVTYYSDLYYASGNTSTIEVNKDTSDIWPYVVWWGTRTSASNDKDYFIQVEFPNYTNVNNVSHGVRVLANDTTLIDEINITNYTGPLILTGTIPEL